MLISIFIQTTGRVLGAILLVLWAFAAAFNTSVEGPYFLTCTAANGGWKRAAALAMLPRFQLLCISC